MSHNTEALSDAELIHRILKGEAGLYEAIVRKYSGYLYKVGRSYGYTHEDTQDLMQETYVNVYLHLKDFEYRSSFKTWMIKIMLHQCYQRKQKSSYQMEVPAGNDSDDKSIPMFCDLGADTGKTVINTELKEVEEAAVRHMPASYQTVFRLREVKGLSINETAEKLHITKANVKVRLHRAKSMLRKEIRDIYSPSEIFEFSR